MAYLDRFKHDIFISYAWSGNIDTDSGDKGWVAELKTMIELELRARLNPSVSIFLDTQTPTNGNVEREFSAAIRDSALLLTIVTPAFCHEHCFCRKEVQWFAENARAVSSRPVSSPQADIAKRFFKVVSRPVHREDIPAPIRDNFTYEFYEGDPGDDLQGSTLYPTTAIKQLLKSRISQNYFALARKLAGYLYECKQMQASFPIRRVFLAETTSPRRDTLIAELKPHETVWVSRAPGMSDLEFKIATEEALGGCDRSVHLLDMTQKLEPARRLELEIQLGCTLAVKKPGFRAALWRDPETPVVDEAMASFLADFPVRFPNVEMLEDIRRVYEELGSYLTQVCGENANPVPPPLPPGYSVFLQCSLKDFDRLEAVYNKLYEMGTIVRFPVFQGKKANVERRNTSFLSESDTTLFYWGAFGDEELYAKCERTLVAAAAAGKLFLLGLDPDEAGRRMRGHPEFKKIPFPASVPERAIDSLNKAINGGGD